MKTLKTFALAAAASAAMAGAAAAADLAMLEQTPYVAPAEPGFDWNGFYVGVLGGAYWETGLAGGTLGKIVGFNVVNGNLLFGAEAEYLRFFGAGAPDGVAARGRLGYLTGADVLLYGALGYFDWLAAGQGVTAGAGAELAMGQQLSGRAEFMAVYYDVGYPAYFARAGLIWHAS